MLESSCLMLYICREKGGYQVEKERDLANLTLFLCTRLGEGISGVVLGSDGSSVPLWTGNEPQIEKKDEKNISLSIFLLLSSLPPFSSLEHFLLRRFLPPTVLWVSCNSYYLESLPSLKQKNESFILLSLLITLRYRATEIKEIETTSWLQTHPCNMPLRQRENYWETPWTRLKCCFKWSFLLNPFRPALLHIPNLHA